MCEALFYYPSGRIMDDFFVSFFLFFNFSITDIYCFHNQKENKHQKICLIQECNNNYKTIISECLTYPQFSQP